MSVNLMKFRKIVIDGNLLRQPETQQSGRNSCSFKCHVPAPLLKVNLLVFHFEFLCQKATQVHEKQLKLLLPFVDF